MVSLYNASIPMMIKYLGNLKVILTKAEQHCTAKNLDPQEMVKFRLIEDMRRFVTHSISSQTNPDFASPSHAPSTHPHSSTD